MTSNFICAAHPCFSRYRYTGKERDAESGNDLCFAKMLSERDKGQILKFGSSFGDDFQLEKRCSIVTNEESKDLQTLFSRKLWSTAMKDVRSSGSGSQIITMMQTA